MKAFGVEKRKSLELRQVTFYGTSEEIRAVVVFLSEMADRMHRSPTFGHAHMQDFSPTWHKGSPDVIAYAAVSSTSQF
jgi:hypothetical protein